MNDFLPTLWPWRLRWPWLLLAALIIVCITAGVSLSIALYKQHQRKRTQSIASTRQTEQDCLIRQTFSLDTDLQTPMMSRTWRAWKLLNRFALILLMMSLVLSVTLLARPSRISDAREQASSRDIILCLDVSGSTLPYDREVIQSYLQFADHFQGERIGLSIFNSTSRTVFPLTDDYALVKRELTKASKLLDLVQSQSSIDRMSERQYQQIADWLEGTQNRKESTSLIGDGLVSCAAMLPGFLSNAANASRNQQRRNTSIVLTTDNIVSGKPTYSLQDALALTKQAGINVDGLYSGAPQSEHQATTTAMKELIERYGGLFLTRNRQDSVAALVQQVERRYRTIPNSIHQSALSDDPHLWTMLLIVCVGAWLITTWRLSR